MSEALNAQLDPGITRTERQRRLRKAAKKIEYWQLSAQKAARSACKLPVVACMTFASGPDGTATIMGNRPADLVRVAGSAGASAVGANCGCGPENYVRVARMLSEAGSLPVWIKPNAGLPMIRDRKTVFPMGPEEFAGFAARLVEAGARFLGGCCGTTPAHIVALRSAVKKL